MLAQHYHIIDSEKCSDIREVEIYVNNNSNIEIQDGVQDDEFRNLIVLTPEMAKDLIDALTQMLE